ncbi:MAG: putative methyltransferase [Pelotomaculum sp. PtaB.Bin013]|nr:MAG: putative methyltransferase [Pelotomaculum sp. PtaB.Bin013]
MSFHAKLIDLLKTDSRFVDENGDLIIAAVQDRAWKMDRDLIKLLLSDVEIKAKFFEEIEGHWIFNINTFLEYIMQKNFLDNSYTRFRNRIGLTIEGKFIKERGEVSLVWAYKDCVLEGGQTKEEDKRTEIFFNENLAQDEINRLFDPKVLTNFTRYTTSGSQPVTEIKRDENGVIRENLIIKGNNLIALHSLKSQYRGKIKLIYIDPPFNTSGAANTFSYNNNFNHSSWLTFMKNRLEIAMELLSPNGILVIAIDDYEMFYLGVLADEIFSRENRIGVVVVETNPRGRSDSKFFATSSEHFLVYAKDANLASINSFPLTDEQKQLYKYQDDISYYRPLPFQRSGSNSTQQARPNLYYPIFYNKNTGYIGLEKQDGSVMIEPLDVKGNKRVWRHGKESFLYAVANGDIVIKERKNKYIVYLKDRIKEGRKPKTVWVNPLYDASAYGTMLLQHMFGKKVFSYPKSINLIKDILRLTTLDNDLILDFFAGSGTTGHAVIELNKEDGGNRQFILCEQMNYTETVTLERIKNVIKTNGTGSLIYFELSNYNQFFIDKIQSANDSKSLLTLWNEIAENSFLNWYVNPALPEEAVNFFIGIGQEENGVEKQKRLLTELLDKNQLYVNLSEIDDERFHVSEEDKALNRLFYGDATHA